jgi:hypothetical protein
LLQAALFLQLYRNGTSTLLKTKTILQKGAMNDDGCDDDDDRQEQLSSQAAVLQGMAFLLVMEILGNGSVDSQILHFAKLPSTLMHRQW